MAAANANLPHITLNCPTCGAQEKAVGDLEAERWHCFNCEADGDLFITMTDDHAPIDNGN
jgi:hypothetical protein